MPDIRPKRCKICGGHESVVGDISWRGKCLPCGLRREKEAIVQLAEHDGPVFDHWRMRLAASVGAALVDDHRKGA